MEHIILKPYTDKDYDFVYNVKKDVYKKYVEECFGSWNEQEQREYFEKFINNVKNNAFIIMDKDKAIGFYNGEILENGNYEIGNICLIKEYQNKGIGTYILKNVLDENKDRNIEIQYFKQNPVGKLYTRLGFVPNGETKYHYQMIKRVNVRYYCSGFDIDNAFGHGLGDMFLKELKDTKSIIYIPGGMDRIEKAQIKHVPAFKKHFESIGIKFTKSIIISPEMSIKEAKKAVREASFIMLMGGDPFKQKQLCEKLDLLDELKNYQGVMLGYSAGAMLMSKYIIVIPCSEEYPDFHIEKGLNLDDISIYPHNNTNKEKYPNKIIYGDETYQREDLIKVANEYGSYYLLQDYLREDGLMDVSIIKSTNNNLTLYTENDGKIWQVESNEIVFNPIIKQ